MDIHFLGTGEALTNPKRQNTCLFLAQGNDRLLIDCNSVVPSRLMEKQIDYTALEHIFLTHYHVDHIIGIVQLMKHLFIAAYLKKPEDQRRTAPMHFYGNADTLARAKELLRLFELLDGPKETFPRIFHELPMTPHDFKIGSLKLRSFPTDHANMPTLGLIAQTGNGPKMIYSADTVPHLPIYDYVSDGDILIHECNSMTLPKMWGHTTWPQLREHMKTINPGTLYLVHLPQMSDQEESQLREQLALDYGDRLVLSRDGDTITV